MGWDDRAFSFTFHTVHTVRTGFLRSLGSLRSLRSLCLLFGVLALLLAGCNQQSAQPGATSIPAASDAQQVLRVALGHSIGTLDPTQQLDANGSGLLALVWPTLVTLDAQQQPHPWAAQSIDISPDGLTYTFHLYKGLTWSDGTPLDAQIFAYSLNRLLDPCTASHLSYHLYSLKDAIAFNNESCGVTGSGAPGVSGSLKTLLNDAIIVQDPQTLIVKLQQPSAYFLTALSAPACAALPQQLIAHYGAQWTDHLATGTGFGANLFLITTWDSKHQLTLQRNQHFWGKKPLLREIDLTFAQTPDAAYSAYLSGQSDIGYAPVAQYSQASAKKDFHQVGNLTEDYFAMNWRIPPFDDVRMRQAFALALNKQSLVQQVFQGTASPTDHIVPQGVPGYNTALTGPDGSSSLTGNVVKAQQLEQSYIHDVCSGQVSQCPAVTLTIASGYPTQAGLAQAALAMWKTAFPGYPVTSASIDAGTFFDDLLGNVTTPTLQFWATFWVGDYPDPQDWLSLQFLPTSAYNSGSVNMSDANSLMIRADGEPDLAQRMLDYQRAEQLLVNQVAWIPLDQEETWWESATYVTNFAITVTGQTPMDVWQHVYIARH